MQRTHSFCCGWMGSIMVDQTLTTSTLHVGDPLGPVWVALRDFHHCWRLMRWPSDIFDRLLEYSKRAREDSKIEKKNKMFVRDWIFQVRWNLQSRMRIWSEPNNKGPNSGELSRLKVSSANEIVKRECISREEHENFKRFKREWSFSRFGVLSSLMRPSAPKVKKAGPTALCWAKVQGRPKDNHNHNFHRETKGRFRKRVVLANVPSLRFFVPGEHANLPSFPVFVRGNMRTYPRSGFRSGGTSAKTTLLENHNQNRPKNIASDVMSTRQLMAHQVKKVCDLSVFHIIEGACLWKVLRSLEHRASSRSTRK